MSGIMKIRERFLEEKNLFEALLLLYALVSAVFYLVTPYALIPAVLIPILFLTMLKPEIYLALTFLTIYIQDTALKFKISSGDTMEYPVYIIFLLLTLASWILKKSVKKETKRQITPLDLPLLIIFLVETFTLLWTPNLELGLHFLVSMSLGAIIYYLITAIINDEKSLKNAVFTLVVSTLIIVVTVQIAKSNTYDYVIQMSKGLVFSVYGLTLFNNTRPMGLAGVPSSSELMVMVIFLFIPFAFRYSWFKRNLFFIVIMSMFYAICVMSVRSAMAAAVIGIVLLFYFHPGYRKHFIRYTLIYMITLTLIVLFFTPGFIDRTLMGFGYTEKLWFTPTTTPANTGFLNSSTQGIAGINSRWMIWRSGFEHFVQHMYTLLIGIGMSGFVYISKYTSTEAHSLILSFLFDMGLVGILLLMYLLWKIAYASKKIYSWMDGSLCADIAMGSVVSVIAVLGVNEIVWGDLTSLSARYNWIILAFLAASYNILKNKRAGYADK